MDRILEKLKFYDIVSIACKFYYIQEYFRCLLVFYPVLSLLFCSLPLTSFQKYLF